MRIGIDIDDTLTDTSSVMEELAIKYNDDYEGKLIEDIPEMLRGILKDNTTKVFFKNHAEEICSKVKIKEDAKEIMDRLLKEGHEIYLITARSKTYFNDPYIFTKKYLEENNINYTKLLTNFPYKVDVCKDKKIDIFFDDSYDTVEKICIEGIDAVLYESDYNKDIVTNISRVSDWKELYNYVNSKCKK